MDHGLCERGAMARAAVALKRALGKTARDWVLCGLLGRTCPAPPRHKQPGLRAEWRTRAQVYIEEFDTVDERLMSKLQKGCDDANVGIDIISIRVTKPRIPVAPGRLRALRAAQCA